MICYRDMTFCCHPCRNAVCPRNATREVKLAASARGLPICYGDLRTEDCGYAPSRKDLGTRKVVYTPGASGWTWRLECEETGKVTERSSQAFPTIQAAKDDFWGGLDVQVK